MTLDELKKLLREKQELQGRTELVFHQLTGQVALLIEQIKIEEKKIEEQPK